MKQNTLPDWAHGVLLREYRQACASHSRATRNREDAYRELDSAMTQERFSRQQKEQIADFLRSHGIDPDSNPSL